MLQSAYRYFYNYRITKSLKACQRLLHTEQTLLNNEQNLDKATESSVRLKSLWENIEEDKKRLQWRNPMPDHYKEWNPKLKAMENTEQTSDYITMMQQPIDLSPSSIKGWWNRKKEIVERTLQQYLPERHEKLGADLAAAHVVIYRGGSVKFLHDANWIQLGDDEDDINLPNMFDARYKVEGLRCDGMNIYYEGLENLRCLQHLTFLSFRNEKNFDDWCLDRVSGSECTRLKILDISGTLCTLNGFSCLYRLSSLEYLIVDDAKQSIEHELVFSMLQECIPKLKILSASTVPDAFNLKI